MKGANNVTIDDCKFQGNDAGYILGSIQMVGLLDNNASYGDVQRASTIYIDEGSSNINIEKSKFQKNTIPWMKALVAKENIDLYNFFPDYYFESSQAALINIKQKKEATHVQGTQINITIKNCEFKHQNHSMVLGNPLFNESTVDPQNYASLMQIDSKEKQLNINFEANVVHNFTFRGSYSALFALYYTGGYFTVKDNVICNIGYNRKGGPGGSKTLPIGNISASGKERNFLFTR